MRKGILAGLLIGVVFLWIALGRIDLDAAWQVLRETRLPWALAVFAGGVAFIAVKTLRWSRLIRPFASARFTDLQRMVYLGSALNLLVTHTGEFLRSGLLSRDARVPMSTVMATVAIERMMDFIALLVILGIVMLTEPSLSSLFVPAGSIALAIVVVALVFLLLLLEPTPRLASAGRRALGWLPPAGGRWVGRQLQLAAGGLVALRDPRAVLAVFGLSLLQWGFIVMSIWASARAVDVALPVSAAVLVFALTVIGLTLPSSPAQLGTTQLAFVVGMEVAGAAPTAAFAASIVYTVFVVVASMLIGGWYWLRRLRNRPLKPHAD